MDLPDVFRRCSAVGIDAEAINIPRSWWIADDRETIAGIADQHGLDPDKVLAANLHCATFVRSKLHLNSKLRHHTAVLLPGC